MRKDNSSFTTSSFILFHEAIVPFREVEMNTIFLTFGLFKNHGL